MSLQPGLSVSGDTQWAFQQKREPTDKPWARAFLISVVTAAAAGTYTWLNRNPVHDYSSDAYLHNAANCAASDAGSATGRSLLSRALSAHPNPDATGADIARWIGGALLTTAAVAVLLACALLLLFEHAATFMVYASLIILIGHFAIQAIAFFAAGLIFPGVMFAALTGFLCWWMHSARDRLHLVARLLSVASDGLKRNRHLVSVCLGLNVAVVTTLVPLAFGVAGAMANGSVVANGDVSLHSIDGRCMDAEGHHVACCDWQPSVLGQLVSGLVVLVWMWATAVIAQIKVFTVAGSITQWYFSGESRGTTLLSLRHATTVNFGSVCFTAAILTLCNILRSIARAMRHHRYLRAVSMIFMCLFSFVINAIAAIMRAVTQFATVQMAATGEPFLPAARSVIGLLMRQGMNSYTVWWLPQFVLFTSCFAITTVYARVFHFFLSLAVGAGGDDRAVAVAVLSFLSALFVFGSLLFTANILKNIVDTVYVCYARDLENHTVTKPEVHAVYADLPKPDGAVVVQPDAGVMYGAMEEGAAGPPPPAAAPPAAVPPPAGVAGLGAPASPTAAAPPLLDDQ